jgi:hypothetical protein
MFVCLAFGLLFRERVRPATRPYGFAAAASYETTFSVWNIFPKPKPPPISVSI